MFCSKSCSHTLWYVTLLSVFYTFGINAGYQQNKECGDFDFQNDMRFFDHSTSHFVRWLQRDSDPDGKASKHIQVKSSAIKRTVRKNVEYTCQYLNI